MTSQSLTIAYDRGTLVFSDAVSTEISPYIRWDSRTACHRAEGHRYGPLVRSLHAAKIPFSDAAKAFEAQAFTRHNAVTPRPYQRKALAAWMAAKGRGVVVLPTGAGKSLLAMMAIEKIKRPALIVVPTLDLMEQWQRQLHHCFGIPIGLLGGGERQLETITVATYDSALLMMESIGNRFGLLICDECHHLPSASYRMLAVMSIAPYRLGLTATPERVDGGERDLYELLGDLVYSGSILDLEGNYLAPYRTEQLTIPLDETSRLAYDEARKTYLAFVKRSGVQFRSPADWSRFVALAYRSKDGKRAMQAYRSQRALSRAATSKLNVVWELLQRHRMERVLLFTDDNATAYAIGTRFFLPVLTHHTRMAERKALLDAFRSGELPYLVTSKVLNEGVDVPEAAVGIVVSGSGSVREHVQRLGRILRPQAGKEAVLYELISENTSEERVGMRRRMHSAYQRSHTL